MAALAVVLLGATGWRLASFLLPGEARSVRAALALVLGTALLCAAYGVLGQLCTRHAADVELVFHGDPGAAPRSSRNEGAGELRVIEDVVTGARATTTALCAIALGCALASLVLRRSRTRPRSMPTPRLARLLWIPIALSGLAALCSTPRGYDALWYHLPLAAAFAQNGHLEPPGRDLVFYFPGNFELVARTIYDVLGRVLGIQALALAQLPFAFALAPLAAAFARRLGAGRAAFFAGAVAIASPMVVFQAGLGYTDVLALCALAAALVLLHDALRTEGRRALWLAAGGGACLGVLLGAKYAAIPLVATGLCTFALCALGRRLRELGRASVLLAVVAIGIVLPAWFWYLRNLRLTGNPIFPIAIPQLGLRGLFTGDAFNRGKELELVGSRLQWLAYPWMEGLSHESGFGAAFVTLLPTLPFLLYRRLERHLFPLGWGTLYLAAWWLGTPHEVRHLMPLLLFFGAPATVLLRGTRPLAQGLRLATATALAVGTVLVLRLQLFSVVPELSVRPVDFSSLYGLPERVFALLPPTARVANLAGRPYNLAAFGPSGRLRFCDSDRGATHVILRATSTAGASVMGERWRLLYEGPVQQSAWTFWGGGASDIVRVYERVAKVGETP